MAKLMFFVTAALMSSFAYAQDPTTGLDLSGIPGGAMIGKLLAIAVALQFILRGVAEALTKLSVTFHSDDMTKVALYANKGVYYAGKFVGIFGVGTPSEVKKEIVTNATK